jgi:hypothetical protein
MQHGRREGVSTQKRRPGLGGVWFNVQRYVERPYNEFANFSIPVAGVQPVVMLFNEG